MDNKQMVRSLRPIFNKPVFALLIFYEIMNVCVIGASIVQLIILFLRLGPDLDPTLAFDQFILQLASNGWGYILAYAIGAIALLKWKKPRYCFREIWRSNKKMSILSLLMLLCLTTGAQAVYNVVSEGLYQFFNLFGVEYGNSILSDIMQSSSVSMVIYTCILAPVGEEILFRGVALRAFSSYGKKFAIVTSAILFGLFHGNLEQSIFAFVMGLLLGYVTVEYSMVWSVVLHAFNNLVLCYLLPMVLGLISPFVTEFVLLLLIWGCAIGGALILFFKRFEVGEYLLQKRIHPLCLKAFFTAPTVWIFFVLMIINIATVFYMQF